MRSILSAPGSVLRQAIAGRALLVFDLDGTLAPIVVNPRDAALRRRTRRLLATLAKAHTTVVLTGRDRLDAARILRGVPVKMIVGNHGLDLGGTSAPRVVSAWCQQLRAYTRTLHDVRIERKELSLTMHYRGAPDPGGTRRRVLCVLEKLTPRPRVVPGKASLNVLPDIGLNKGTALRRLLRHFHAPSAIYVGDDATDEDAFIAARDYAVVTVRVGTSSQTAARYSLASQALIDSFLRSLIAAGETEPAYGTPRRGLTAMARLRRVSWVL